MDRGLSFARRVYRSMQIIAHVELYACSMRRVFYRSFHRSMDDAAGGRAGRRKPCASAVPVAPEPARPTQPTRRVPRLTAHPQRGPAAPMLCKLSLRLCAPVAVRPDGRRGTRDGRGSGRVRAGCCVCVSAAPAAWVKLLKHL
eukprot:163789-Prymnesium_polylepis.1